MLHVQVALTHDVSIPATLPPLPPPLSMVTWGVSYNQPTWGKTKPDKHLVFCMICWCWLEVDCCSIIAHTGLPRRTVQKVHLY